MLNRRRLPVAPLEAGAGPENPPCPACGEPLFGWLEALPGLAGGVRRCESCGLAVIGEPGAAADALRELDRLGGEQPLIVNPASFAAALGGAGWAGLQPGVRYLFTVEAARRLVAGRDQVVRRRRWAPGAGLMLTWQTLLNSVTFGRNAALVALGRGGGAPAPAGWQRRIDALASIVLAIPALIVALPIELAAVPLGRTTAISLHFELL